MAEGGEVRVSNTTVVAPPSFSYNHATPDRLKSPKAGIATGLSVGVDTAEVHSSDVDMLDEETDMVSWREGAAASRFVVDTKSVLTSGPATPGISVCAVLVRRRLERLGGRTLVSDLVLPLDSALRLVLTGVSKTVPTRFRDGATTDTIGTSRG